MLAFLTDRLTGVSDQNDQVAHQRLFRSLAGAADERVLPLFALPTGAEAERQVLPDAVGTDYPCWALLGLAQADAPETPEEWRTFLSQNRVVAEWLRSMRSDDVQPILRRHLRGEIPAKTMRDLVDEASNL